MPRQESLLGKKAIDWLLEEENPSIRYFALRDLLNKRETDPEVQATRKAITNSKLLTRIFSKQNPQGFWEESHSPYHPKYKSSYWQIMTLGQLGSSKDDKRVEKACEHIFQFQHEEGGFSSYTEARALKEYEWVQKRAESRGKTLPPREKWVKSHVFESQYSCLTGNMSAALVRLGYENDVRVRNALKWLVKIQNRDGGWLCPYWKAHVRDKHGCFYGTICPLEAFSEVSEAKRSQEMKQAIEKGAGFLLMHRLYKADHHGFKPINPSWLKLSFPWFYGYNILRGLSVLTKLGYVNDERLEDAAEVLLQKRRKDGTWILESAPAGRMHANIESVGKPSKWITLHALKVLKRLNKMDEEEL